MGTAIGLADAAQCGVCFQGLRKCRLEIDSKYLALKKAAAQRTSSMRKEVTAYNISGTGGGESSGDRQ